MPIRAERESDGMNLQSILDELNQLSNKRLNQTNFIRAQGVAVQIAIAQRLDRLNDHLSQITSVLESIDHRLDDSNINRDHYFRTANPNKI